MKKKITTKPKLNKAQLKATAGLFLEIAKAVVLATIIGLVFPEISGKIKSTGAILGGFIALVSYLIALRLLKEVDDYNG